VQENLPQHDPASGAELVLVFSEFPCDTVGERVQIAQGYALVPAKPTDFQPVRISSSKPSAASPHGSKSTVTTA
jgi:hypothetical protein